MVMTRLERLLVEARKGLEAYVSGWIKDVSTVEIAGKYLTSG